MVVGMMVGAADARTLRHAIVQQVLAEVASAVQAALVARTRLLAQRIEP